MNKKKMVRKIKKVEAFKSQVEKTREEKKKEYRFAEYESKWKSIYKQIMEYYNVYNNFVEAFTTGFNPVYLSASIGGHQWHIAFTRSGWNFDVERNGHRIETKYNIFGKNKKKHTDPFSIKEIIKILDEKGYYGEPDRVVTDEDIECLFMFIDRWEKEKDEFDEAFNEQLDFALEAKQEKLEKELDRIKERYRIS